MVSFRYATAVKIPFWNVNVVPSTVNCCCAATAPALASELVAKELSADSDPLIDASDALRDAGSRAAVVNSLTCVMNAALFSAVADVKKKKPEASS